MAGLFHYFVEGECEAALLKALMHSELEEYRISSGKIEVFNVIYNKISATKAMTLKKGTVAVFVFDTDIKKTDILEENIDILLKYSCVEITDIWFVSSNKCLEDELIYSCSGIQNINNLFNTTSKEDFKKKLIKSKNIVNKLKSSGFDIDKIWSRKPNKPFGEYEQKFKDILKLSRN